MERVTAMLAGLENSARNPAPATTTARAASLAAGVTPDTPPVTLSAVASVYRATAEPTVGTNVSWATMDQDALRDASTPTVPTTALVLQ